MEFLSIVNSLGPVALIILLLVIVIMQLKQYREDVKSTKAWVQKALEEQKKLDAEQNEKILYLQTHCVSKEEMFQQFGGWRTELNEVNRNILHLTEVVSQGDKK